MTRPSPPSGRWRQEIESPSDTPMLDLARILARAASIAIGGFALILLAGAVAAHHEGQVVKYALFLVVIVVANVAVELAIRRRRPPG